MSLVNAIEQVLAQASAPLPAAEITRRILEAGLWKTNGKTPAQTVIARLVVDINAKPQASRFQRTAPGVYALRVWGLPEYRLSAAKKPPHPARSAPPPKSMSFTDAAEKVLETFGNKQPLHYRVITEKALELKLIRTQGQTPEATLYAQVMTEINRQKRRGLAPRFARHGQGHIGLTRWMATGLAFEIEQHNTSAKKKLQAQLLQTPANEFEALIGKLLVALGFEEVTVTGRSGDGGIDARGTLVVGDVIKTRMAVQAKRWKQNVQSPIVQQVRGSLGTHEQGLIITTSDFSAGARSEAERPDAIPVALMNGTQLVALLVEHSLGVHRTNYDLIELGEPETGDSPERGAPQSRSNNGTKPPYGGWLLIQASRSNLKGRGMRAPYTELYVHCVWATWDRRPLITDAVEAQVYAAIHAKSDELQCPCLAIGGMPDHVHVLARLHTTVAVADLLRGIKGASSHLVTHLVRPGEFFKWQGAYGAFTVTKADLQTVIAYIEQQKQHHAENGLWDEWEQTLIEQEGLPGS